MSKAPASRRKLEKARSEGKVAKSQILTQSLAILALLLTAGTLAHFALVKARILLESLSGAQPEALLMQLTSGLRTVLLLLAITSGLGALTALLVEMCQVGLHISVAGLAPQLSRISPAEGLKRFGRAFRESWRTIARLLIAGAFAALAVSVVVKSAIAAITFGLEPWVVVRSGYDMIWVGALIVLVLGMTEYFLNRRQFLKELEMDIEEQRREAREDEGDPLLRGLRRALHREMSVESLARTLARARVVIVERA